MLARQVLYHLSQSTSTLFVLSIFQIVLQTEAGAVSRTDSL
jgi:hypothetical protein